MFDRLLDILSAPQAHRASPGRAATEQLAIAAVLVEAARADGEYLDEERQIIDDILATRFGLGAREAAAVRGDAEAVHAEATDLVRFTRVLKEAIPHEERVSVIEAVWRVIYADETHAPEETALIRRLSGLLYLPDREAGLARQRVEAALARGE